MEKWWKHGGTKEESLRAFLNAKIQNLTNERSTKLKDKLKEVSEDPKTPAAIVESMQYLIQDNEVISDFLLFRSLIKIKNLTNK